jgi:antirestriction protein ArdC
MPSLESNFNNNLIEYIAVLSHEATHSTGIEKRLNRFNKNPLVNHKFGS